MGDATRGKGKVEMPPTPIPSAEVRERIMAKRLLDGYRQWIRDGRPSRNGDGDE